VTSRIPHLALCALAAAALAIAGCGDSEIPDAEKLPADISQDLLGEFERIEARVDANVSGACDDIFEGVDGGNFDQVSSLLDSIPDDVAPEIRSALSDSVDHLQQLVDDQCDEIRASEQGEVVPEETTPEETTPTETETIPTETETVPPETETTPTPPVDPGNGNGQGPNGEGPPGQDNKDDGGGVEVPGL
jgi:hypothetical protein